MKHKKLMALLLTACMVMGAAGCGGGAPATPPAADSSTEAAKPDDTKTESDNAEAPKEEASAGDNLTRGGVGDGQYKESPLLHELVEKGELPPIEERLPKEPAVVEVDEIGVYGGTYAGAAFGPTSGQVDTGCFRTSSPTLFRVLIPMMILPNSRFI